MSVGVAVRFSVNVALPSTERSDGACIHSHRNQYPRPIELRPEVQLYHKDEETNVRQFRRQVTATQPLFVSDTHSPW